MKQIKILVVGGGAREHTIVWKLAQSRKVKEIFVAPGNAGTAQIAQNLDIPATDVSRLVEFARTSQIDLTVVGPEAPLAQGIADHFLIRGLPIFGPTRIAAELESSKVFAKELMQRYHVPCARSVSFSDYGQAVEYVSRQSPPLVIKADGLAAGKGVIIASTLGQAEDALSSIMEARAFGDAGSQVIVEEYLPGREMSVFAFADAHSVVPMVAACDYKRLYDGDQGPNTGGMGSYSPPSFINQALAKKVAEKIMAPVVQAMHDEGRPYKGVLYGGLMVDHNQPRVLEFNARFGDPEAQVILPLLETDLVDIMLAVTENRLDGMTVSCRDAACVGVVMASGGYPGQYQTGLPITGLDELDSEVMVFHGGTSLDSGRVVTDGGRVLTVVATGQTLAEAREIVYNNVSRIQFEGCHYRRDIALLK